MTPLTITISTEFSRTPGPRSPDEGNFSGREFLRTLLEPRFLEAREKNVTLIVNLDGGEGYATSFLEESFGGLARKHGAEPVLATLKLISTEEPYLVEEIEQYIREARG